MRIGKLGVWANANVMNATDSAAFARRVESWGYGALWVPEVMARDPLITCAWLLANTATLTLATGIANIHVRDAFATVNAQYGLAEQSAGRFLLGLGVSHGPFVAGALGHTYEKPASTMRRYLADMARMQYMGAAPAETPKTVIAALGPKMLEVAATFADGAHPYNVTPEHTAEARRILGPGKLLCPEQMVLLEKDPSTARAIARKQLALSFTLPNYSNNYLRMGFGAEDLENGGSDRLIDSVVAWGDETTIRNRIEQHWAAGADHVCIQPLRRDSAVLSAEDEKVLELLAPEGSGDRMIERTLDHYPVAIVEDRYGGVYSGGQWLAIAIADEPHEGRSRVDFVIGHRNAGPHGDDSEAMAFWCDPPDWIAVGISPQDALDHLNHGIRPVPFG